MTDVRTQSAEAAKLNEDCALIAALLGGTKTMRAAGRKYLPQWPGEDSESYDMRLAVATLFLAYARTIDVLSAKPFSKPVTLGEDVPERLKPWLQNVDLSGRDLHSFLSEITQEAMGYGFAGILVDFPKAGNLVTKADEQAAGVRPYFVQVHVQNVLGWLPPMHTLVSNGDVVDFKVTARLAVGGNLVKEFYFFCNSQTAISGNNLVTDMQLATGQMGPYPEGFSVVTGAEIPVRGPISIHGAPMAFQPTIRITANAGGTMALEIACASADKL